MLAAPRELIRRRHDVQAYDQLVSYPRSGKACAYADPPLPTSDPLRPRCDETPPRQSQVSKRSKAECDGAVADAPNGSEAELERIEAQTLAAVEPGSPRHASSAALPVLRAGMVEADSDSTDPSAGAACGNAELGFLSALICTECDRSPGPSTCK